MAEDEVMRKTALVMLLAAFNGMCRTPTPDTLQALLVEVRHLRQNIEAMTVASQRVQIALYGLQLQDAAVARATQRLNDARNKRMGVEANCRHAAEEGERNERQIASGTLSDAESQALQGMLPRMKRNLDTSTAELQSWQAMEAEASTQLRTEQAKLAEIQDRIERLDKF